MKSTIFPIMISATTLTLLLITGVAFSEEWIAGSGTLYVDPTTTNVGIGTTDLDGTPAIGKLTLKGTTSDGSTNILVGRDSAEANVFSVNTDGKITGSLLTGQKITLSESVNDDTNEVQIYSILYPTTTSSSTSYHIGSENRVKPIINTGVTQSGYEMGLYLQLFRNSNGVNADDNGTLSSLIGQRIQYGHYNSNTSADPHTTNASGLSITPYCMTGDITNMYDIYLSSGSCGGVVTNRYGIYQASTLAKNYFGGNVGIGTTSPGSKLSLGSEYPDYRNRIAFYEDGNSAYFRGIGMLASQNGYYGVGIWSLAGASGIPTDSNPSFVVRDSGNVGIGTIDPTYKLAVNGTIRAKEVKVESNWSDFVFDNNYNLPSLDQVESYIEENNHLPDIPSADEIQENGLSMAEMMAKQMQKIEELILYVIEQNKQIETQNNEIEILKKKLAELIEIN